MGAIADFLRECEIILNNAISTAKFALTALAITLILLPQTTYNVSKNIIFKYILKDEGDTRQMRYVKGSETALNKTNPWAAESATLRNIDRKNSIRISRPTLGNEEQRDNTNVWQKPFPIIRHGQTTRVASKNMAR